MTTEHTLTGATRKWRERRQRWQQRLPVPCARCGMPVQPWHTWDLDHWPIARSQGGSDEHTRPSHATCNQAAGRQLQKDAAKRRADERNGKNVDPVFFGGASPSEL